MKKVTQPRLLACSKREHQPVLLVYRYVPGPVQGVWGAPCRAIAHEKECCMALRGSSCLCLRQGHLSKVLKGA